MQNLIEKLRNLGNLSQENEKALINVIQRIECDSKTILQKQDEVCNSIYFVEKGIARTFYFKDGKDITHWIALEGDFIGATSSFFMRELSNKFVETIAASVLWKFDYYKLEELFSTNRELEKLGRLFSNYGISLMEKRFDNLHFNTAKERYTILLNQQPEISKKVPLGMIASYLGITQETLSRIRKQK